ncbi:MAG: hypothetical protein NXI24_24255 [bacterium]|nr:hypothetical protein [bacterium]
MRKYVWLIGVLLLFFAFAAQAIIGVKLLELRSRIQRDRILNLELSSQALQARSRRLATSRRDFRSEIRQSVIESGLLNSEQPEPLSLSIAQYAGLGAINTARVLAFKPPLFLFADYESLLLMRYAFYLERNRRYTAAIERYQELINRSGRKLPLEMRAFVSLHLAYCLASVGDVPAAIERLQGVQRDHAGTHFSRAAGILLHALQDGERRRARLTEGRIGELARARSLVQLGQCAAALQSFERHRASLNQKAAVAVPLGPMDSYREALCFEETGQIRRAISGYQNVVRETRDRQAAVLSNRRLLIVGNFYAGDSKALVQATADARRLGDTGALAEITSVAKEQEAPLVLEEIRRHSEKEGQAPEAESSAAAQIFDDIHAEVLSEIGPLPGLPPRRSQQDSEAKPADAAASAADNQQTAARDRRYDFPPPAKLMLAERDTAISGALTEIRTVSGERLRAKRIEWQSSSGLLRLRGGTSPATIPFSELQEIRPEAVGPGRPGLLEIALLDGRVVYARGLRRISNRTGADGIDGLEWIAPTDAAGRTLSLPAASVADVRFLRTP